MKSLRSFFVLWISQFFSSMGSSMTSFGITIWAYAETESVMVLSTAGIAAMLPRMIGGIFAGPLVDRLNKKAVLMVTDLGAGLCSLVLILLLWQERLQIGHIYALNIITSLLGSVQQPVNDVVISRIVPKEHYTRASGMQAFSSGTVQVLSPVFAALLLAAMGMTGVVLFDLMAMGVACLVLLLFIKLPASEKPGKQMFTLKRYFAEMAQGFRVLGRAKLLVKMMTFFAFINMVAGMTYYNLLSPMILARTGHNAEILAWVNGALGLGGIAGGILATILPAPKKKVKAIFVCAAFSFLCGDVLLALGPSYPLWILAAFLSSILLPFLNANESYLWRTELEIAHQGCAFSFKYAIQSGMIPIGIWLGGLLAEAVFEPYMNGTSNAFSHLLGNTQGSGMALMFLLTGITGTLISLFGLLHSPTDPT